ncbi:type II secretion system protein [Thiomicrospira sp. ALE5]|uniref:type II secretion system protein n=1 Tax=Thiomicrospira sp. ALE5 TaxID=748650 RepID=UPI0008E265B0|nr:type II secretion system protein [Thiomicrospira sp. ALE5]SFR52267.1 prepilin-type N-terminal cleavage/methylation domain-containing protein [Thiomicrospira sp. ALE5]
MTKTTRITHDKHRSRLQRQRGFSLIEIAIVLVIIGLLITGITKGAELITNARINTAAQDVNNYAVALVSYEQRYGNILTRAQSDGNGWQADSNWQEKSQLLLTELSDTGFITPKSQHNLGGPIYLVKNGTTSGSPIGTLGSADLANNGSNSFNWALCYGEINDDSHINHLIRLVDGNETLGSGRARLVHNTTLLSSSASGFTADDNHRTVCFEI